MAKLIQKKKLLKSFSLWVGILLVSSLYMVWQPSARAEDDWYNESSSMDVHNPTLACFVNGTLKDKGFMAGDQQFARQFLYQAKVTAEMNRELNSRRPQQMASAERFSGPVIVTAVAKDNHSKKT